MHKQTAGKQLHFFLKTIALLLIDLQKYIIATEAQKHRKEYVLLQCFSGNPFCRRQTILRFVSQLKTNYSPAANIHTRNSKSSCCHFLLCIDGYGI